MVNFTCYLLIISNLSFFYSLAIGPGGEEESSDEQQHQQQLPFPTNPGGLSANAKPFHPKDHPRHTSSVPTRPQQQHFPPPQQTHQFATTSSLLRAPPPFLLWNHPQYYIPPPGTQQFVLAHGIQQDSPPQEKRYFHPHQSKKFPPQQRKNVPPRQRNIPPRQQRQSVRNDLLSATATGPSTSGNDNNAGVTQVDSAPLGTSSSGAGGSSTNVEVWRRWNFDCPANIYLRNGDWEKYMQKTDQLFSPDLVNVSNLKLKLPSEMAKAIPLNRKDGIALFRENIVTTRRNGHGGYFSTNQLASTGKSNSAKLVNIDEFFRSFISLALHELPNQLKKEVDGIFVNASHYGVKEPTERYNNNNKEDLPCKFNFQLWIRDRGQRDKFWKILNKWNQKQRRIHGMFVGKFVFMAN